MITLVACTPKPSGGGDENSSSSSSSGSVASGGSSGSVASSGTGSSSSSSSSSGSGSGGTSGATGSGGVSGSGTTASSGSTASSGVETCTDDCADGTQVCDQADGFRVCGSFDADSCLDLSPRIACPTGGYVCSGGQCLLPCTDECPVGTTACQGTTAVISCGNFDTDSCRELGGAVPCDPGHHCETGACVPDSQVCTDECTTGSSVCFGNAVRTCGSHDADACLDLSAPVACGLTETCTGGICVPNCTDECTTNGARQCSGNGYRVCGNTDADSCLEWGTVTACTGANTFCDQGTCVTACTDECTTSGATQCTSDGTGTQLCGQYDADTCLDLATAVPCGTSSACTNGACAPTCTDDCTNGDPARCTTDATGVETCGNYDADACLEYGGAVTCQGSANCTQGACNIPCTDDCTTGARQCSGSGFQTCGQFDTDACTDWSAVTACQAWETCTGTGATCVLGATPNVILLNEIVFDPAGTDTAAGNNLFVELYGPAGAPLDGYEVVGINGSGGAEYNAMALDGETLGGDGFYLIAHPLGAAALVAQADKTSNSVDFQNGPDSVQVRWHGRVVDALGYGTFGSATFGGEGTAAPFPSGSSGKSLSRSATHADTNDNAADFVLLATPTPRGDPAACTDGCTTGSTQCSGTQVQTCGNYDADSCLEWSTPANCSVAGEQCTGTACVQTCTDDCSSTTATQCSGTQLQTCGNYDADPCREWSTPANCPTASDVCTNGVCAPACADECPTLNATRCQGTQVQSCVTNADADPCREWSTAAACPVSGEQCSGGSCTIPCTDECPTTGATSCVGSQVRNCGQYDADNCLDWGTPAACSSGSTCVAGSCQAANAPEVVLLTPQGTLQTTQGVTHRMLVDATAAPGRTITAVRYFADGVQVAQTTASPHAYDFVVPTSAVTGSTITLQAKAVDDLSVVGSSASAYLQVRNDRPVATFAASISGAGVITVDAGAVTDTETAQGALEVCWDWDNNNSCDTAFSTTKLTTHDYGLAATTVTVRMVVRDAQGQTAETTRSVTFQNIQYIGGTTLTTTTWYGTIVVTGDIIVGSGQTLTVSAGTQVLFVRADTDSNGVGDYTITVNGALVVNGTAANPVVFTGQDAAAKVPGGWDRIILNGAGSTLSYVIVEYADVGVEIRTGATLDHVTVRSVRGDCIVINGASNVTLTDVDVNHCAASGAWITGGSSPVTLTRFTSTVNGQGLWIDGGSIVSVAGSTIASNTYQGAHAGSATLNIQDSILENNGDQGLVYEGSAAGTATHNQVRQNGKEGVLVESNGGGSPSPVITLNNIYSNASQPTRRPHAADPALALSYSGYATSTTGAYTAPSGSFIRRVLVNYNETEGCAGCTYVSGQVLNGATNAVLRSFTADFSGEVYLPANITSIKLRIDNTNGYSSYTNTFSASSVGLVAYDGASDVVADTYGSTVNTTRNYLGTWPFVLTRVALARAAALDLQGFVGAPMDATWNTDPYKSGNQASGTWSGTVYITGNVTIPAGNTLAVAAGTQVVFIPHDQDANGQGDFSLTATGAFNLQGTAASRVAVVGYGAAGANAWQTINLNGTGANASAWSYVTLEDGRTMVAIRGPSSLSQVNLTGAGWDGVMLQNATGATLTDITVTGAAGSGLYLSSANTCTLTRVTVDGAALQGVAIDGGSGGTTFSNLVSRNNALNGMTITASSNVTVQDSTFRANTLAGILVQDSSPTINYSLLTYNHGAGLRIEGSSNPVTDHNIIKFNDDSGVVILAGAGEPVPTVQYSNIYGNAVTGSTFATPADPALSLSYSGYATSTSGAFTAAAGQTIRRIRLVYNETEGCAGCTYVSGQLLDASNNAVLRSFTADFTGWVVVPDGITSVKIRIDNTNGYSSYTNTFAATSAELLQHTTTDHYELTCATSTGTTLAKFNYWTASVGNVPNLIQQARTNSVDYTGYTGIEYPTTGSTAVGPRP